MSISTFIAVIPARGGSQRVPGKNIRALGGSPLLHWTAKAALGSQYLSRCILTTDSEEIAQVGRAAGLEIPFLRPSELSTHTSSTKEAALHALKETGLWDGGFDAVVILQPTSPFRTAEHIDRAIELFIERSPDSLTSVYAAREHAHYQYTLDDKGLLCPFFGWEKAEQPRQLLPPAYMENGAIYILGAETLRAGSFYGQRVVPFVMDERSSWDIDTELDFQFAEFLMR